VHSTATQVRRRSETIGDNKITILVPPTSAISLLGGSHRQKSSKAR
jgi:hypothetical protein